MILLQEEVEPPIVVDISHVPDPLESSRLGISTRTMIHEFKPAIPFPTWKFFTGEALVSIDTVRYGR